MADEHEVVAEEALEEHAEEHPEEDAPKLDPEAEARRVAAMSFIRKLGDPVLKSKATEVTEFDAALEQEAKRMIGLMQEALGIGLAATQLGVMRRLLVFQSGPDVEPRAVVNPEVEWVSGEQTVAEEGCLSLANVVVDVERPLHARISAVDLTGSPISLEASGLEARVLQHEIDHLDGVLILDRTSRDQRKQAMRAMREAMAGRQPDSSPAVSA